MNNGEKFYLNYPFIIRVTVISIILRALGNFLRSSKKSGWEFSTTKLYKTIYFVLAKMFSFKQIYNQIPKEIYDKLVLILIVALVSRVATSFVFCTKMLAYK